MSHAALTRDEDALRALADSLPALTAYAYERHRARAFANALRGARDSAVAELCLGVAACPPAASTFVADSAQLRLLSGDDVPAASTPHRSRPYARVSPRLVVSGAALAAAVAALAVLPVRSFDEPRPNAADGVASPRPAPPVVVVADPRRAPAPPTANPANDDAEHGQATLVRATRATPTARVATRTSSPQATEPPPSAVAVSRRPRTPPPPPAAPPRQTPPTPASEPAPPQRDPVAEPTPAPAPAPALAPTAAPASEPAESVPTRSQRGKAYGKAQAPGQSKKTTALPPPTPTAPPVATAAPSPGTPDLQAPHPGRGRDDPPGRRP